MSLRSPSILRRPLAIAATAMMVLTTMVAGPLSPATADGDKDQKISERATIDQQLEDLRIDLGGVNDGDGSTYI